MRVRYGVMKIQRFIIDYWWNSRNTKTYLFNPSDSSVVPKILFDRNYQDRLQ